MLEAVKLEPLRELLAPFGLELHLLAPDAPIPGSYWGEPEAGLIGFNLYARPDTPLHSLLHEAGHSIVAPNARRALIHTDASDSDLEENAACYLQILLSERLPGCDRERAFADMDAWGYSFRLGSTKAWFLHDADDAIAYLGERGLLLT